MSNLGESHLLEELSGLEHTQWIQWSRTVFERLQGYANEGKDINEAINLLKQRWQPNWIDYDKLDWDTKEFDREWSRQVLGIIRKYMK